MADLILSFEHKVLRRLKMRQPSRNRWLVAVSGGADSMVLLEVLKRWRTHLKCELVVAHIHHGTGKPLQERFRERAQKLIKSYCAREKLRFVTNPPSRKKLKSEAEFREYRHEWLRKWSEEFDCEFTVFAHHRDDLLETRLMRLIRGTGEAGLGAMTYVSEGKLRPLLDCSRAEIEVYAKKRKLKWVQDPSNIETEAFRNWLRHKWLPLLEKKQPGASKSLARSLEILSQNAYAYEEKFISNVGLRRAELNEKMVATYLRQLGIKNYGRTHVEEILKRIDTRRKNLTFEMLGFVFKVTPDLLMASRV